MGLINMKNRTKPNPHTYRVNPTFTMSKKDFESYRKQVMRSIKTNRMALMSDGNLLKWIDEQIKQFSDTEKKEDKPPLGV